ncbi:MAG TPA: hypothetical protein DCR50_16850, partial [Afipia sp.]|nr:hypothetical protein [Afipia sp.]
MGVLRARLYGWVLIRVLDLLNTKLGRQCSRRAVMQEYDLYINAKKPAIGLYVRKGAGLPDL